jgi:7-keto-8-aminopelargonate synthetase-like enzyme
MLTNGEKSEVDCGLKVIIDNRNRKGLLRSLSPIANYNNNTNDKISKISKIHGNYDQSQVKNENDVSLNGDFAVVGDMHELSDFSSNDYLGLSRNPTLISQFIESIKTLHSDYLSKSHSDQTPFLGSTGSRLLSGNSQTTLDLEAYLAEFVSSISLHIYKKTYMLSIFYI